MRLNKICSIICAIKLALAPFTGKALFKRKHLLLVSPTRKKERPVSKVRRARIRNTVLIVLGLIVVVWSVQYSRIRGQRKQALVEILRLQEAVQEFRWDHGRCPHDLEELSYPPAGGQAYYRRDFKDPWRRPYRMICPGRVYRRDLDVTHLPMFHQLEALVVGERISMADLKGTLSAVWTRFFGEDVEMRLRPGYFPFVEPGAEYDVSCRVCAGTGCRVCKGSGWIELGGAGMVHPAVFEAVDLDPERYSGFAFGLGIDRIAMMRYGIDDLRLLMENDVRFLRQFPV